MQDEIPVISEDSDAGNTCERLAQDIAVTSQTVTDVTACCQR